MNAQRISWMTGRRKTLSTLPATINEFRDGTNTNGLTKRMPQKVTKSILLHTALIYVCMACISQTWYWVKAVWHVLILIFYWVELMFNFALSSPSVEEKKSCMSVKEEPRYFWGIWQCHLIPMGQGANRDGAFLSSKKIKWKVIGSHFECVLFTLCHEYHVI